MSKKAVRIISAIIAIIFLFGTVSAILFEFTYADTQQQLQQKKDDAQKKIDQANKNKVKSLAEKERLEKEAGEIQTKIEALDKVLDETKANLAAEEIKLEKNYNTFNINNYIYNDIYTSIDRIIISSKSFKISEYVLPYYEKIDIVESPDRISIKH